MKSGKACTMSCAAISRLPARLSPDDDKGQGGKRQVMPQACNQLQHVAPEPSLVGCRAWAETRAKGLTTAPERDLFGRRKILIACRPSPCYNMGPGGLPCLGLYFLSMTTVDANYALRGAPLDQKYKIEFARRVYCPCRPIARKNVNAI